MILKKSYWAKWLENNRRRSWTFLLCLVMALFCGPLYLMVVLTGLQNNYANDSVYNAGNIIGAKNRSRAEFAGGLVLILMGIKILLEHLGVISF